MYARQHQDRASVGIGKTMWSRYRAARIWRVLPIGVTALLAGAVALPSAAAGAAATPGVTFTKLTLLNGWTTYPFGSASPAVAESSGIVYFRGALSTKSSNTNNVAFILPPRFRPAKFVNVPVDMCNATPGELNIAPTGVTEVISAGANSNATCFTSLDGVSFAPSTASFTALRLRPGWKNFGSSFRKPAVRVVGGIVHFEGEIRTAGKNLFAFTLPARFRPIRNVHIVINVCTGSIGELNITPKGVVRVQVSDLFLAQCGTSLDGATFVLSPKSFTGLTLRNGWKNAPAGTGKAGLRTISGIVRFRGAIRTSGANADPFILPAAFRPAKTVYIPVAFCDGDNGRLDIRPSGVVVVETEGSSFTPAQCLTSLDGAWFAR